MTPAASPLSLTLTRVKYFLYLKNALEKRHVAHNAAVTAQNGHIKDSNSMSSLSD